MLLKYKGAFLNTNSKFVTEQYLKRGAEEVITKKVKSVEAKKPTPNKSNSVKTNVTK